MRFDWTEDFVYLIGLEATIKLFFLFVVIQTNPPLSADATDEDFVAVTIFLPGARLGWLEMQVNFLLLNALLEPDGGVG